MEIIKIGSDAMKISLNRNEANGYGLNQDLSSKETRNSFVKVLVDAKRESLFKINGEKISAEIFFGKNGGCEIFVSKVEVGAEMYKEKIPQETVKKQRPISSVFMLESLDDLLSVAYRLNEIKYKAQSSLYYDESSRNFYIILDDVSIKDLKYAFLTEYSQGLRQSQCAYVKEHYKCICKKDAVSNLRGC